MKNVSTKMFAASCVMAVSTAVFAVPTVSDVTFAQNASTRKVTITYKLANDPGIVTVDVRTNGVTIGAANLSGFIGDVNKVVASGSDTKTITWQPDVAWPNHRVDDATVVVTAWAKDAPPPYWVIDLGGTGDKWHFYASAEEVPGGITNRIYKSEKLVMRRIPAKNVEWRMGAETDELNRNVGVQQSGGQIEVQHQVIFTKDYFMSVYEVTNKQFEWMCGAYPSGAGWADHEEFPYMPANGLNKESDLKWAVLYSWQNPNPGDPPETNSKIAKMRTKTGVTTLTFPTQAQWEYACRAGTRSAAYNGDRVNDMTYYTDEAKLARMGEIAWYSYNSEGRVHEVGLKKPNAFGLYDMLGNVREWCFDYYNEPNSDGNPIVDPVGPADRQSATGYGNRVCIWSSYHTDIGFCRASCLRWQAVNEQYDKNYSNGLRLCCDATIP